VISRICKVRYRWDLQLVFQVDGREGFLSTLLFQTDESQFVSLVPCFRSLTWLSSTCNSLPENHSKSSDCYSFHDSQFSTYISRFLILQLLRHRQSQWYCKAKLVSNNKKMPRRIGTGFRAVLASISGQGSDDSDSSFSGRGRSIDACM